MFEKLTCPIFFYTSVSNASPDWKSNKSVNLFDVQGPTMLWEVRLSVTRGNTRLCVDKQRTKKRTNPALMDRRLKVPPKLMLVSVA